MGHVKRIYKDACRVAGAIQETSSSKMFGGQGSDFLKGCVLEHHMVKFAKMILRDRRSTFHDLASLCGRRNALDRWSGKITKDIGTISSALDFPFLKDVSQNCFVFDVVKFKN